MTASRTIKELPGLRQLLSEHLPWSPRDYVQGISRQGDRAIHAEQLTAEMARGDDLRAVVTLADGGEIVVFAERLPWDSEFFGYGVARLNGIFPLSAPWHRPMADSRVAVEWLCEEAARRDVTYLFAVVDPRDLSTTRALGESGFALIETRFYHFGQIDQPVFTERLPVRKATENDIPSLAKAASGTVNIYDRFHADPFITEQDALRLMEKWVEQSVTGQLADVVIVPDVSEPGALVTYRYHRDKWDRWGLQLVQGVFSAVAPEFKGWMGKLGPEVNYHLLGVGARCSYGSTQVANRPIIWFAEEAGARFGKCEYIFRRIL